MRKNGEIFKVVIVLLCLPAIIFSLSLRQAQESLLYNNLDIVAAYQDYCKKSFEEAEAKSGWWPSLDVVGSYDYFSERNSIKFPDNLPVPPASPLSALAGKSLTMGNYYRAEAGLDLSYPITSAFVNIFNVRYRHLGLQMKDAQNEGLKSQLSFKLGALYFLWSLSYGQAEVYQTLVTQLTEQAAQVKNLKTGGVASSSNVLDALARLASAKADLVTAQNQTDSLRLELVDFTQCKDSAPVPEEYSFDLDPAALMALDTVTLNDTRPELAAMDLGMNQLLALQDIIRGQKYPNLIAVAGYRYGNPGLRMGGTDFMGYAEAGLTLKWNLFDGFKVTNQRKQTAQQAEIIKYQKQQQIDAFNNAIKNAKLQITRAIRQQDAAQASLAAAEAVVTDAKNSLTAGIVTQTDYLNALTARARAALAVKQAAFMRNMAVLQLYFASGKELKF
ncbi:MAG TPA: TolC family protein [Chitinivibrionales bacterium]|nr:TolC family protein [Chitinivibrionales bacterium]